MCFVSHILSWDYFFPFLVHIIIIRTHNKTKNPISFTLICCQKHDGGQMLVLICLSVHTDLLMLWLTALEGCEFLSMEMKAANAH